MVKLLSGSELSPIYTILAILFLEQGYATIYICESLLSNYVAVSVSDSCTRDLLAKLSNIHYK